MTLILGPKSAIKDKFEKRKTNKLASTSSFWARFEALGGLGLRGRHWTKLDMYIKQRMQQIACGTIPQAPKAPTPQG